MVEPFTPVEQVANDLFIPDIKLGLQFATSTYDAVWKLETTTVQLSDSTRISGKTWADLKSEAMADDFNETDWAVSFFMK